MIKMPDVEATITKNTIFVPVRLDVVLPKTKRDPSRTVIDLTTWYLRNKTDTTPSTGSIRTVTPMSVAT